MKFNHKTIWGLKQNKATYVVKDIIQKQSELPLGIPLIDDDIYKILLARGVFKWFSVRRQLIKYKDFLKRKINNTLIIQRICPPRDTQYWRGYRKACEDIRKDLRKMCHSQRWQVADNDKLAKYWLEQQKEI